MASRHSGRPRKDHSPLGDPLAGIPPLGNHLTNAAALFDHLHRWLTDEDFARIDVAPGQSRQATKLSPEFLAAFFKQPPIRRVNVHFRSMIEQQLGEARIGRLAPIVTPEIRLANYNAE